MKFDYLALVVCKSNISTITIVFEKGVIFFDTIIFYNIFSSLYYRYIYISMKDIFS